MTAAEREYFYGITLSPWQRKIVDRLAATSGDPSILSSRYNHLDGVYCEFYYDDEGLEVAEPLTRDDLAEAVQKMRDRPWSPLT